MKKSMLEYSKHILEKVSFDQMIFKKEYKKFKRILPDQDRLALRNWVKKSYQHI